MKSLLIKYFTALIVATMCFSCGQKYTLEYNLTEGETYNQNFEMEMTLSQSMMGQDMVVETNMEMQMSYHIDEVMDNLITMTFVYDALSMEVGMGGMTTISASSETSNTVATMEDMGPIFKAVTNLPITMIVDKKGNVEKIEGFENYIAAMLNVFDESIDDMIKSQVIGQFSQQFTPESLESSFKSTANFPDKPVAVGNTWNTTAGMQSGVMNLEITLTNKLVSVDDNIATIESKGELVLNEPMIQNINGMETKSTLHGTQSGFSKIDMNTGWTISGEITQEMNIETEVMGMTMPQKVINKMKISN